MSRFEIVRTDAAQPWHARFRAWNGKVQWTTENYTRRRAALAAIESIAGAKATHSPFADFPEIAWPGNGGYPAEIRDVDEREVTS